nr:hypothetical protein [Candidatus Sigynarchaeum springense]
MQQMREKELEYYDFWDEFYHGILTNYGYDKKNGCHVASHGDMVAFSFYREEETSAQELKAKLAEIANV